jgi:UDP:flavonoid glycosyltransferase YjiC (YdhE family)
MEVLLVTVGSHGDVHPFVGLGLALRARGHKVKIAVNGHFESLAKQAGLDYIEMGSDESYRKMALNADLFKGMRAAFTLARLLAETIRPQYDAIVPHIEPNRTVVVASSLALGARVARDKIEFPLATVHLSPSVFRSIDDPPILAGGPPRFAPRFIHQFVRWFGDRFVVDPTMAPAVNELRKEFGLAPVKNIFRDYWHSPDCVIGMFPDWYAHSQSDWPANTRLTGFPLFDETGLNDMPRELTDFLGAGEPPVVFTPGSAMWNGQRFFRASIEACRRINRRGILLTRHVDQIPKNLPNGIIHVPYAPFSQLLPHAAALVHHGGIGTSSQAMRAGVRQLVIPMAYDQFDNAARLKRLGVARVLPHQNYTARRAARELRKLISREYGIRCHWVREWFRNERPLDETCRVIEQLAPKQADDTANAA